MPVCNTSSSLHPSPSEKEKEKENKNMGLRSQNLSTNYFERKSFSLIFPHNFHHFLKFKWYIKYLPTIIFSLQEE
jgi:hypothetical protein